LIHDFKDGNDSTMKPDGPLCAMFVKNFMKRANQSLIANPDIQGVNDEDMKDYLQQLWVVGTSKRSRNKGNIRKNLSLEKTAVYAAIQNAFNSK
jgi:hypothetical protein